MLCYTKHKMNHVQDNRYAAMEKWCLTDVVVVVVVVVAEMSWKYVSPDR